MGLFTEGLWVLCDREVDEKKSKSCNFRKPAQVGQGAIFIFLTFLGYLCLSLLPPPILGLIFSFENSFLWLFAF